MKKITQIAKDLWDVFFAFMGFLMFALDIPIQLLTWGYIKQDLVLPIGLLLFLIFGLIAIIRAKIELINLKYRFPNIIFGEQKCIEITSRQLDIYGEKSLIGSFALSGKIHLFCIDFFNKPILPNGSKALGVQISIEFYDKDNERQSSYLGRWIDRPENAFGVKHDKKDILCNGIIGDMLGIAVINNKGDDFLLLDSSIVDNRTDGTNWDQPHLLAGKYTIIVRISGENFSDISKIYEIQNLRDERLIFSEKKDSRKWLREIKKDKKERAKMWTSTK